jgi:phage antirepressor YoqD-like protein
MEQLQNIDRVLNAGADVTMKNLSLVKSEWFGSVQCDFWKDESGEIWMTRKQIGEALGYADPQKAIDKIHERNKDRLDKFSVTVKLGGTDGKMYDTVVYNARGIYEICRWSRQPKADEFYDMVYDVLETIRKTGGYVANEDAFIETYLPYADEQTKMTFRATLALVRKQNEQIAAMKPKVDYFDALVERNLLTNFRDTAKELGIKEREFIAWLLDRKYVYRDQKGKLKPYAQFVPELFQLKEWTRNERADVQTLITPKGRETFRLLLKGKVS